MKRKYFTVGPTEPHPKLKKYLTDALKKDVASMSHRGPEFSALYKRAAVGIRAVLGAPASFHVFFLGSATEAMERIIENCVERESLHFVNGAFSKRFYQTAVELKKHAQKIEAPEGRTFDFTSADITQEVELIALTHSETSNGVQLDLDEAYELKRKYPQKLIALDIVSSAPYPKVDYRYVDAAFFSVQKGFGLPSGLGVLLVNDACIAKSLVLQKKGISVGTFHSFPSFLKSESKLQTPETPNVLGIYLLARVCEDYLKIGVGKIRKETEAKAKLLYSHFDKHPTLKPFVKDKTARTQAFIVIETPGGSGPVIQKLASKGFDVGAGYGQFADRHIRIGNFPQNKLSDVRKILRILR